jgi:glycosyltransferase involved in cell wall biosynthesis
MKKLLYITDKDEYTNHSFIGPLFEKYLKKYFTIDIVYFTEFKSDFEKQDEHRFLIPSRYKTSLINELEHNNILVDEYSYIIVRNNINILKHTLKEQNSYNYKLGFRLSFPKIRAKLQLNIANNNDCLFDILSSKLKVNNNLKIINECNIFLPTSQSMKDKFFENVHIPTIICPPGIDPDILYPNIQHKGEEKRFFYAGTLDSLREFNIVLEAFSKIKNDKWSLTISTRDINYAKELIKKYNLAGSNIKIFNAKTREELLELIALADIGVALLPNIPIYNTSIPIKILDYYSSAVPCIMTNTTHSNIIFTNNHDAWFCKFTADNISTTLQDIILLTKEDITKVGTKGQLRLLGIRNYKTIAQTIAQKLESL